MWRTHVWWWMVVDGGRWMGSKKVLWFCILENLQKLFSIGKKSDFKFQNRGYFGQKNIPQISWNFGHNYFTERWFTIFRQKISKTFLNGQKSNFKSQNRGYFGKKILRKVFQTSVIISWWEAHAQHFGKNNQKLFEVEKNPTSNFKIGGILPKKYSAKILELWY